MEINSIPEAFQTKLRLSIISALINESKTFKELKNITEATDGNLGAQLAKLEEIGYIESIKEFINKKPQTTYNITLNGKKMFREYVEMLEAILNP